MVFLCILLASVDKYLVSGLSLPPPLPDLVPRPRRQEADRQGQRDLLGQILQPMNQYGLNLGKPNP